MSALRLILTSSYVVKAAALGCMFSCGGEDCLEYTGDVPAGYTSLEDWYAKESGNLHCWSAQTYTAAGVTTAINLRRNANEPAAEIGVRENLTAEAVDSAKAAINSASVFYYPEQRMGYVRTSLDLAAALSAGDTRTTVSVSHRFPAYQTPLEVYCSKQVSAYIGSTGKITIRAHEALAAGATVIVAGWWAVATDQQ